MRSSEHFGAGGRAGERRRRRQQAQLEEEPISRRLPGLGEACHCWARGLCVQSSGRCRRGGETPPCTASAAELSQGGAFAACVRAAGSTHRPPNNTHNTPPPPPPPPTAQAGGGEAQAAREGPPGQGQAGQRAMFTEGQPRQPGGARPAAPPPRAAPGGRPHAARPSPPPRAAPGGRPHAARPSPPPSRTCAWCSPTWCTQPACRWTSAARSCLVALSISGALVRRACRTGGAGRRVRAAAAWRRGSSVAAHGGSSCAPPPLPSPPLHRQGGQGQREPSGRGAARLGGPRPPRPHRLGLRHLPPA